MGSSLILVLAPQIGIAKTLSGKLTFDRVPDTLTMGLDYNNITQKPIRNAKVQLLDAQDKKIKDTVSENDGSYKFTFGNDVAVKVRVLAETDSPSVMVQDNTNSDALYSMQSDTIDTSADTTTANFNAASGWGGTAYTSTRVSAPFACLDTIYTAAQSFVAVRPKANFPLLKVNWSVDNRPEEGDPALGQIGTSHYASEVTAIFILGKEDVDTDEFDSHVMVHEWGHYFEDKLSRSDSPGGTHGGGDILDPRLAFGEGWGNALSAMILYPDSNYKDSNGPMQATTALVIALEDNLSDDPSPGWFSEFSIGTILYDLFDPANESFDHVALGLGPIYDVMTKGEKNTDALTSIFSFVKALKDDLAGQKPPVDTSTIDTLLAHNLIAAVQDEFGAGETNNGGSAANLPVYRTMTVGGPDLVLTFLSNVVRDNQLGANRFIRFDSDHGGDIQITATSNSDIALTLYDSGKIVDSADNTTSGAETITLKAKGKRTYILVVQGHVTGSTGTYTATVSIQ